MTQTQIKKQDLEHALIEFYEELEHDDLLALQMRGGIVYLNLDDPSSPNFDFVVGDPNDGITRQAIPNRAYFFGIDASQDLEFNEETEEYMPGDSEEYRGTLLAVYEGEIQAIFNDINLNP